MSEAATIDDADWADRNKHWISQPTGSRRYQSKRERRHEPLILCGHGVSLRVAEAQVAASYFAAWRGLPLVWRSKWKHPIPDEWLTTGARNSLGKSGHSLSNRNAKHPMNAVLNYAYGMLRSQVHIAAIAEGYDPRRGIMHHDRDDGDAFAWVFDMIEPRRAEIDAKVLKFMLGTSLTGADVVLRAEIGRAHV